jgi:hypothetical protein
MTLMMEAVRTSETSVYSDETTWRYIPEKKNITAALVIARASLTKYKLLLV